MRIAVHAFSGMTLFHLSTPLLVFGEVARQSLATPWEVKVWTEGARSIVSDEGLQISAAGGREIAEQADLLVFPSWPHDLPAASDQLLDVMRRSHRRGATIAGFCLGAFPVAQSGILDGRSAVTHWARTAALAERHPLVDVTPSALYVDHGDVLTSAGTAAALDAGIHFVRTRVGAGAAASIAGHLVVAPHRDGDQAQHVTRRPLAQESPNDMARLLEWIEQNLASPLTLNDIARHESMSSRNLARRFRAATGTTPARWIRSRRLDAARRLLEGTDLGMARVAEATGFASAVTFRQAFSAAYATTPTSYRTRFTSRRA